MEGRQGAREGERGREEGGGRLINRVIYSDMLQWYRIEKEAML